MSYVVFSFQNNCLNNLIPRNTKNKSFTHLKFIFTAIKIYGSTSELGLFDKTCRMKYYSWPSFGLFLTIFFFVYIFIMIRDFYILNVYIYTYMSSEMARPIFMIYFFVYTNILSTLYYLSK